VPLGEEKDKHRFARWRGVIAPNSSKRAGVVSTEHSTTSRPGIPPGRAVLRYSSATPSPERTGLTRHTRGRPDLEDAAQVRRVIESRHVRDNGGEIFNFVATHNHNPTHTNRNKFALLSELAGGPDSPPAS
jgi:hypothetical protein